MTSWRSKCTQKGESVWTVIVLCSCLMKQTCFYNVCLWQTWQASQMQEWNGRIFKVENKARKENKHKCLVCIFHRHRIVTHLASVCVLLPVSCCVSSSFPQYIVCIVPACSWHFLLTRIWHTYNCDDTMSMVFSLTSHVTLKKLKKKKSS